MNMPSVKAEYARATKLECELEQAKRELDVLRTTIVNLYDSVTDESAGPEFKKAALQQAGDVIGRY